MMPRRGVFSCSCCKRLPHCSPFGCRCWYQPWAVCSHHRSLGCLWVCRKLTPLSPGFSQRQPASQGVAAKSVPTFFSRGCFQCLLSSSLLGPGRRGEGSWRPSCCHGCESHESGRPGIWQQNAGDPAAERQAGPHPSVRLGVLGRAARLRGGCRQRCCCCCSRDAAWVFFCLCFFPRAGTVRLRSREGSPRGAGMIHQPY